MEYIKCYWKHNFSDEPVLLFYEIDPKNQRFAARFVFIYSDGRKEYPKEYGIYKFVTEASVPEICEINTDPQFMAYMITKPEFEEIWEDPYKICTENLISPEIEKETQL